MKQILVLLIRPGRAGAEFRPRGAWLRPFAVIVAARLFLAAALHPAATAATVALLPPGAGETDRVAAAGQLARELPAQLMLLPVKSFLGFAMVTAVAAFLLKLWRPPRPLLFTQVLAVVTAAEGTVLAGEIVRAGCVLSGASRSLLMPLGLDLAVAGWFPPPALALANAVNLFALWYIVSLAAALASLTGLARGTTAAVAVSAWALVTSFQILVLAALRVAMHIPV